MHGWRKEGDPWQQQRGRRHEAQPLPAEAGRLHERFLMKSVWPSREAGSGMSLRGPPDTRISAVSGEQRRGHRRATMERSVTGPILPQ
jgi:hypothetical protein